ncbi:lytic transglycosylase domain-containing protein [Pseudomonas sp. LPH60]|uniref:lytic transglycosylase domain-containing protein n=1 Tax=Pseudomonas sp. LPH60 TaxID=3065906 RepID=UPI00273C5721|nr:lytic transglycosylase domain-containing protein [Pseudomonas sp. LPH60]MDP4573453.1 lytic transglycosylase domain-containing protein [Pseudomonas sp. LPH60]
MLDFLALAQQCAPTVAPQTMAALVQVESKFNPYVIGVVGGRLERQPKTPQEAAATARALEQGGWNFSMGIAQVNRYNLSPYKLDYQSVFDPCANLRVGSKILEDCYTRAKNSIADNQAALQAAFSCYYSGNFTRGFKPDKTGGLSYVQKVLAQRDVEPKPIQVVPLIKGAESNPPKYDKAASTETELAPRESTTTVSMTPEVAEVAQEAAQEAEAPRAALPPPDHTSMLVARERGRKSENLANTDNDGPVQLRLAPLPNTAPVATPSLTQPYGNGESRSRSHATIY